MRYISIIFILTTLWSKAITTPTHLLRACINFNDSTITIKWKQPTDACGSFSTHRLYGSKNGGGFSLLANIPDNNIIEYSHKLNDQNSTWKYYITTLFTCNGTDSVTSATISIDLSYPLNISLDSVSYDLNTQNIIAGWSKNPSIDTKEYEIYDFSSGNGDSIGHTVGNQYIISKKPALRFPVVIATIDSCNLSSLLSTPHKASYLQGTIDTCLRSISLRWAKYSGWDQIDSQSLYVSKNGSPFTKDTSLNGVINSLIFNKFILGDKLEFYIRSYTKKATVTSSSNKTGFTTRKLEIPTHLYLEYVSVSDNVILLGWQGGNLKDIREFEIHRGDNNTSLSKVKIKTKTLATSDYQDYDAFLNTDQQSYFYQINAINKCNETALQSNISQSIFLELLPTISHNPYIGWDVGVRDYTLSKKSSTWNDMFSIANPFLFTDYADSSGCYRVAATELQNQWSSVAISYSNVVCITDKLDIDVTTGINTSSENNTFKIFGKGIDHTKSSYRIYNRWGELLVHKPTDQEWDLLYKDKTTPPGIYIYLIDLYGQLGEKKTTKGTINVIR